jgi:competence protein ComEA
VPDATRLHRRAEQALVDNADRWAREVVEYRTYDTDDSNMVHLRDELAKYNPAPGVVDDIVSALDV